jgi:nucleotide-binding universal stress UspA family protein
MKELSIKNILVPIDFSELSIRAIDAANRLAKRFGSTLHMINVQEPLYPATYFGPAAPVPTACFGTIEELRKGAALRIKSLAKEHRITGICDAVIGAPIFDELCAIARQIPADLVVTPTHGRTGLKHVFLGSTAERLVQYSPCPVLVLRDSKRAPRSRNTIDTILVPVDFSRCSLDGLNYAVRLAQRFAAKIVVLNVVDFGQVFTADGYVMYDFSKYQDVALSQAEDDLRKFVGQVKFGSVPVETIVTIGSPVNQICITASERGVDLIVTATHGRTGLKHVLIGSVAEVVVRHAPCSVLAVPSHPQERAKRASSRVEPVRKIQKNHRTAGVRRSKIEAHPFPERRKINKFRESHLV